MTNQQKIKRINHSKLIGGLAFPFSSQVQTLGPTVGSTLLGLSEALHIFQVDTCGVSPNPIGLFCIFSCQHILLYFEVHFGALNSVFFDLHGQTINEVKVL